MSKVVANQQDSRGPTLAEERGPVGAGQTIGDGAGLQADGPGAGGCRSMGEPGAAGPPLEEATPAGSFWETGSPGSGLRKATFTLYPSKRVS